VHESRLAINRQGYSADSLSAGEVGFLFANIKTVSEAKIGDTIMSADDMSSEPLPGFER